MLLWGVMMASFGTPRSVKDGTQTHIKDMGEMMLNSWVNDFMISLTYPSAHQVLINVKCSHVECRCEI